MQSIKVDRSSDGTLGDEGIADAVRRELREDASTTDLELEVEVVEGVVHLRGKVPLLEDAENAEAVAATVPGVIEVIEETDVVGL
jgi:osmotically-inducible protein OsmY